MLCIDYETILIIEIHKSTFTTYIKHYIAQGYPIKRDMADSRLSPVVE